MKAVKNVLSWAFGIALIAITFSPAQARADGMPGVRETAKEILVYVPKFCRSVKFEWEVQWDRNPDNENAMALFISADDEKKVKVLYLQGGHLSVQTVWRGGETIRIPKFDAKGRPIRIKLVSILAYGDDDRAFNTNNWSYESHNGRWVNGATISPSVHAGTWGGKC